jgi:hypothetical protein
MNLSRSSRLALKLISLVVSQYGEEIQHGHEYVHFGYLSRIRAAHFLRI